MRRLFAGGLLLAALSAAAGLAGEADGNTLWREDGSALKTGKSSSGNAWNDSKLDFAALPDGGFSLSGEGDHNQGGRYVRLSPDYPWLTFELASFTPKPEGYKAWTLFFDKALTYVWQTTRPQTGVYAFNIYENSPYDAAKMIYFKFFVYNLKLDFKYFAMVKEPDNYITVESADFRKDAPFGPGDTLKFTVRLKEPAEDVTIRFFDSYTMSQINLNKQDKLQLKPSGDDPLVWTAEAKVEALGGKDAYKARQTLLKAVILGGELKQPLWGAIPYAYKK